MITRHIELHDFLKRIGGSDALINNDTTVGKPVFRGENAGMEEGKAKLREYITKGNSPYSFSLSKDGQITVSREQGHPKNGEVWGGVPTRDIIEIVPRGSSRKETLRILQDVIGLEEKDAQTFLKQLEHGREKELERTLKQAPLVPLFTLKELQPTFEELQPSITKSIPSSQPPSAQPHIVLKSGDTVSGLYNSIPKDQRPSLGQFTKDFMDANPKVTDPDKVMAGKDYALPAKYNYEGLKQAQRLIDPSVAEAAKLAVANAGAISASEDGRIVPNVRSQAHPASRSH
jgi:hypothetical protein